MSTESEEIDINGDTTVPTIALLIMSQLNNNAWATGNVLVESYRRSLALAEAKNRLIVGRIQKLLSGPYVPNMFLIEEALYPAYEAVEKLAAELSKEL